MKVTLDSRRDTKNKGLVYITYTIIALLLSVVHVVLLDFIAVGGITPDLLLILIVWIALAEGQFTAIIAGFSIGLLFDVISSDLVGLNALAKTVAAFLAGYFYKEGKFDQSVRSMKFLLIVFLTSFVHNLIYFFFYIKMSEISYLSFFLKYGIALSLYTTVFAIFAMLLRVSGMRR